MSKKYKVVSGGGIWLDGRVVEQGKTFDSKEELKPWCEAMVRRGNLERVDEPAPKTAKA